jgi:23S rRNA pseudouridine2605 synthase
VVKEPQRLQKYLASTGLSSRRQIETMITQKRITVNGRTAKLGDKVIPFQDVIHIDGIKIEQERIALVYYMLNKPKGVITTMTDERGRRCIADIIQDIPKRVFPVGRLDRNTEGLLILTNDGDFSQRLSHPKHRISKVYLATVAGTVSEDILIQFSKGFVMDGVKLQPVKASVLSFDGHQTELKLTLNEGRNRQIRRMCEQFGLKLIRLVRIAIGGIQLDIGKGKIRNLTPKEITHLLRQSDRNQM